MSDRSKNRNLFLSLRGVLLLEQPLSHAAINHSFSHYHWDVQNTKSNSLHGFLKKNFTSVLVSNCTNTDFSPVNEVMTCPIVLAWLAYTFIDVHLTLDSLVTWHTGAGVEPNVIAAQGPILTRVWITFIYFSFTVYSLLEKREIFMLKIHQSLHCLHFWAGIAKAMLSHPTGQYSDLSSFCCKNTEQCAILRD